MDKKIFSFEINIHIVVLVLIGFILLIFTGCISKQYPVIESSPISNTTGYWTPSPGDRLQIQYVEEPLDLNIDADIYSVDLFETSQETINQIHAIGIKVICYVNTGAWEEYRPDAEDFPSAAIGRDYEGWVGEKWLDISQYNLFAQIMLKHLDLAVEKNCDGIDADNMQNFEEETGFDITTADQLNYNIWLSEQTHQRGLSIGLKNDPTQTEELLAYFDWSIIEDCQVYDWCELMQPFIAAGKPVFQVEYTDNFTSPESFCTQSTLNGFSGMLKNRELDAWVTYCP